ncbi:MAG: methyltransferase domain-containing protein [Nanoarchaeota archaeon]
MQDKKLEKISFDKFASEEPWHAFTDKTYHKIIKLFLKLNPKKNDRIIDMGCGTGELTKNLYDFGFENVSGYDISKNCIAMARKNYGEIDFQVKDIETTKLRPNSVDFLVYCGILHHFANTRKVIKEAKRILRKNGKIFVFEPNASNPILWIFRSEKSPFKSDRLRTPNERFLTKAQIRESFKKGGFKIIGIGCISSVSYAKIYFRKLFPFPFFYVVYLYNLFDLILNKTIFRENYGSFIYGYFEK